MSINVLIGGAKLGCGNERMHVHFAQDRDGGWGILDSTVVRVHPCAAGAEKNGEQALGRSRVGFSCKIHVTVDALGNPVRTCLTARQRHLVECFMNKSKHFRRIFSRFDKLDRSYLGFSSHHTLEKRRQKWA